MTFAKPTGDAVDEIQLTNMQTYTRAFLEDGTPLLPMARGFLQKKSKKGKGRWLTRWMELRGPYLMYWHSVKQAMTEIPGQVQMPVGAYDMRRIQEIVMDATGKRCNCDIVSSLEA